MLNSKSKGLVWKGVGSNSTLVIIAGNQVTFHGVMANLKHINYLINASLVKVKFLSV